MKNINRILFWALMLGVFLFLGLYVFVVSQGRDLSVRYLSKAFQRPVIVREVSPLFPCGMTISGLDIPGVMKAEQINLQFGFPFFVDNSIYVSFVEIIKPVFFLQRAGNGRVSFSGMVSQKIPGNTVPALTQTSADAKAGSIQKGLFVGRLRINKGRVEAKDLSGKNPLLFWLNDLTFTITPFTCGPRNLKSKFYFNAWVEGKNAAFSGNKLTASGWFDWAGRDMDAKVSLQRYNDDVWLEFTAVSKDNDLSVEGKVELDRLTADQKGKNNSSLNNVLLSALNTTGVKLATEFSFATKMDAPQLERISLKGTITLQDGDNGGDGHSSDIGSKLEAFGRKLYQDNIKQPLYNEPIAE